MNLFDQTLLEDALRVNGADHSFLKQIAAEDGAMLRRHLEGVATLAGPQLADRWREQLNSLDNRRFFQGFAEATATHMLHRAGWAIEGLDWPGPVLAGQTPMDDQADILVLSFIRQVRPKADTAAIRRLVRTLNRVDARVRIGVHIQKWLPHDFDPEPIRRAVELWLRDVQRHGSTDRYAVYADENVALEFALTSERTKRGQAIVAFTVGPYSGHQTTERIEDQLHDAVDAHVTAHRDDRPLLVCCVADQPWRISPGWMREMLYGKPRWLRQVDGNFEVGYRDGLEQCLFRSPRHRVVSGVLFIDRPVGTSAHARAEAFLNPWALSPFQPRHMDLIPTFAAKAREDREIVMAWSREAASLSNPGI